MILPSENGGMLAQHFPLIAIMSTILCVLAFAADASESPIARKARVRDGDELASVKPVAWKGANRDWCHVIALGTAGFLLSRKPDTGDDECQSTDN